MSPAGGSVAVRDWRKSSKVILKIPTANSLYCESPNHNSATLETTVTEPAKQERLESEAVEQRSIMLTVQVLWACHAWNTTPKEAAKQVVADLFDHLSRGGNVSVHVAESGGKEHTLCVELFVR